MPGDQEKHVRGPTHIHRVSQLGSLSLSGGGSAGTGQSEPQVRGASLPRASIRPRVCWPSSPACPLSARLHPGSGRLQPPEAQHLCRIHALTMLTPECPCSPTRPQPPCSGLVSHCPSRGRGAATDLTSRHGLQWPLGHRNVICKELGSGDPHPAPRPGFCPWNSVPFTQGCRLARDRLLLGPGWGWHFLADPPLRKVPKSGNFLTEGPRESSHVLDPPYHTHGPSGGICRKGL